MGAGETRSREVLFLLVALRLRASPALRRTQCGASVVVKKKLDLSQARRAGVI